MVSGQLNIQNKILSQGLASFRQVISRTQSTIPNPTPQLYAQLAKTGGTDPKRKDRQKELENAVQLPELNTCTPSPETIFSWLLFLSPGSLPSLSILLLLLDVLVSLWRLIAPHHDLPTRRDLWGRLLAVPRFRALKSLEQEGSAVQLA